MPSNVFDGPSLSVLKDEGQTTQREDRSTRATIRIASRVPGSHPSTCMRNQRLTDGVLPMDANSAGDLVKSGDRDSSHSNVDPPGSLAGAKRRRSDSVSPGDTDQVLTCGGTTHTVRDVATHTRSAGYRAPKSRARFLCEQRGTRSFSPCRRRWTKCAPGVPTQIMLRRSASGVLGIDIVDHDKAQGVVVRSFSKRLLPPAAHSLATL